MVILQKSRTKMSQKAIEVLKQELEVDGLEDQHDVLERLEALYTELGMVQDSVETLQKKRYTK